MQIRTRLTLQFIFVVTLIVFFAFSVIYYSTLYHRNKELYQRLENKAITSAEIFISVEQIDSTMLRIFDKSQKDKLPFESIRIYNNKNREVYSNSDTLSFNVDKKLLDEIRRDGRKEFRQNDLEIIGLTYSDTYNSFVVFAAAIDVYGNSKVKNLLNTLFILFFIIISLISVTGWIYSGRALKPLSRVINEVEKINAGTLDKRLEEGEHKDEIGRLINAFNFLLSRIENAFKIQKIFISGASHELKNPLTSITSQLQVVLLNERDKNEYKQIIKSILEDIKDLNKTTFDLIEFARLDYEKTIHLTEIRLDDVIWLAIEYLNKTHPDYSISMRFEKMPDDADKLIINGNEGMLKIAFMNLIDNACKFSEDKACSVTLNYSDTALYVTFSDKGIGLTEDEIKFIFEPFHRTNANVKIKGHGIGLPLTKKIIELHRADITVSSKPESGSNFSLTFSPKLL